MEDSPQRRLQSYQHPRESSSTAPDMAVLTATPTAHLGFRKEYPWDSAPMPSLARSRGERSPPNQPPPLRPSDELSQIILPPIRSTIPELSMPSKPQEPALVQPAAASPTSAGHGGALTSPTYVHSPVQNAKRKRHDVADEEETDRARQVPRLYQEAELRASHVPPSPPRYKPVQDWNRPPVSNFSKYRDHELPPDARRPPSVPPFERSYAAPRPPTREHHVEDYREHQHQRPQQHQHQHQHQHQASTAPLPPPPHNYAPQPAYDYHQSYATTSPTYPVHPYERHPFSAARPYSSYHYPGHGGYSDMGHMSHGGDGKPRKRRGNLPKETTDKLRAWFMAHLTHPYPTEDEKQDLMRATGLQMNQISNWFINARRRQLPTMINNARVETDATSGNGNVLPTTERHDMHHGSSRSLTLSDGEGVPHGGLYDEEGEHLHQRRSTGGQRGSV